MGNSLIFTAAGYFSLTGENAEVGPSSTEQTGYFGLTGEPATFAYSGAINPTLITLFNSIVETASPFFVARIYTITMAGGGILRFTDADCDIQGAASTGPVPTAARIDWRRDLVVASTAVGS